MNLSVHSLIAENAATLTAPPRGFLSDALLKERLFYYFYRGDGQFTTPESLAREWKRIPDFNFSAKQLGLILRKTRTHLELECFEDDRKAFMATIAENWEHWEAPARKLLAGFIPANLSQSLSTISTLRLLPSDRFIARWFEQAESQIEGFDHVDLNSSLYGCACLGLVPPESFLKLWLREFEEKKSSFEMRHLANSSWSIAALDSLYKDPLHEAIFRAVAGGIKNSGDLSRSRSNQKQIHDSYIWFTGQSPVANPLQTEDKSSLERQIIRRLDELGYDTFTQDKPIKGLNQAIDFSVSHTGGQRILVEIDGPTHFLFAPAEGVSVFSGKTIFRSALCHKLSPHSIIVRMPSGSAESWLALRQPKPQRAAIDNFIGQTLARGGGVYTANLNNGEFEIDDMPIAAMMDKTPAVTSKPARQLQPA